MNTGRDDPFYVFGEALAVIEIASIAQGIVALDQMVKRAKSNIVTARTLSTGRYFILLCGSVAEVEESLAIGLEVAAEEWVDHTLLRDPTRSLLDALAGGQTQPNTGSLAILEFTNIAAALFAADRVLKETDANLGELRLGTGLGGKAVFTLWGAQHMVEAALELVRRIIAGSRILRLQLIPQPHPDLPQSLLSAEGQTLRGHRSNLRPDLRPNGTK